MQQDDEWLNDFIRGLPLQPKNSQIAAVAHGYQNHMQRLRPASDWHDDIGDALWYRLPVSQPPFVGSPADSGWFTEPVYIFNDGMTNAEYFTHFQTIQIPEH